MAKNNLNRNDPCHCGNGKKYKVCHGNQKKSPSPILYVIIVFIFGIGYWFAASQNTISTNQKISSKKLEREREKKNWDGFCLKDIHSNI